MSADVVCTTRDVDPCSTVAQDCETFKSPDDEAFKAMFPDAYAKVCAEPANGDLCLYTDVVYKTCGEAEMSEFTKPFCQDIVFSLIV